jgi:hypothetical protein
MIKYSDASNIEKTGSIKVSSSLPKKICCEYFIKEAGPGNHVCPKCHNRLHKVNS